MDSNFNQRIAQRRKEDAFSQHHLTKFWKVLLFAGFEVGLLILSFFLCLSPYFKFSFKPSLGLAFGLTFAGLSLVVVLTSVTYALGWHHSDLFIYNFGFYGVGANFYTGCFWIIHNDILYWFLLCVGWIVVLMTLGGLCSIVARFIKKIIILKKRTTNKET